MTSRRSGALVNDFHEFIEWFNTSVVTRIDHPPIPSDVTGPIAAPRFRRTLAWHIVRRPGGTIAGATQYGHLGDVVLQGYAGRADSGFADNITFEEFLLRAEQLHDDHQRLCAGEHVSGPAAAAYRTRVEAGRHFAGTTVTTATQAKAALSNADLQIHHGALLTCVYKPTTAACRSDASIDAPDWSRCRPSCANAARTDRDIRTVDEHIRELRADLNAPGLPAPLRHRLQDRLAMHQDIALQHRHPTPSPRKANTSEHE